MKEVPVRSASAARDYYETTSRARVSCEITFTNATQIKSEKTWTTNVG